jgi:hypothetical protein
MRMSRWDVQVADMPLGDPYNAPGSSQIHNDPFTAVAVATTLMSAYGSYQQGQAAKQQYGLQAKMATLEGERKQIQYQQRGNDTLRRRNATNAAIAARAAAGGINPFSGSPDVVRAATDTAAGREYSMLLADADAAFRAGRLQAKIYESAGEQAARKGTFDALAKLGMAAASFGGGTQAPAEIVDKSTYSAAALQG